MSAIDTWKHRVEARNRAGGEDADLEATWWDETRAAWFNRFAGRSDRSAHYRFIAPYVRGRVLEIGPGPGAYTRLLVQTADEVVAVEPSPHMAGLLRQNLGPCPNLRIVDSTIEDWLPELGSYDLCLAANVLEGVAPIGEVLGAIAACTRVLAIGTWSNAVTPAWSRVVQTELLGHEPEPDAPSNEDLLAVLAELGLRYEVHVPETTHGFASREQLLTWIAGYHGLTSEQQPRLPDLVAPYVVERDGRHILSSGQPGWVVIAWGKDKDVGSE